MKNTIFIGLLTAGVILGGAVAVGATNNDTSADDHPKTEENKDLMTMEEVGDIALNKQAGRVEEIEVETEAGEQYYDVEIENDDSEYDVQIEAATGKVVPVNAKVEDDLDDDDDIQLRKQDIISEKEAIAIAEKEANGRVTEIELDEDDRLIVYEVEVISKKSEVDIEINAVTGEVIKKEND